MSENSSVDFRDRDMAQPLVVAAFDFDGTLTTGGSVFSFLIALRGKAAVLWATFRTLPKLVRGALLSGVAADIAKESLFSKLLRGVSLQELERISVLFANSHLERRIRPLVKERLEWHLKSGHYVLIVSASPECYVKEVGKILGVDGVLATRLSVGGGGLLTGGYEGKNCRGSEKHARVLGWMRANNIKVADSRISGSGRLELWAYGNSRGDLRLLSAADHGVNVGRLGRFGRLRQFPSLDKVISKSQDIGVSGSKGQSLE